MPYSLNLLISIALYGPNLKNDARYNDSQCCLTISQLILFNSTRTQCSLKNNSTSTRLLENPLFLCTYIGLNVHSFIRSKKLIEQPHHLGISISYNSVIQIEKDAAYSLCARVKPRHSLSISFVQGVSHSTVLWTTLIMTHLPHLLNLLFMEQ